MKVNSEYLDQTCYMTYHLIKVNSEYLDKTYYMTYHLMKVNSEYLDKTYFMTYHLMKVNSGYLDKTYYRTYHLMKVNSGYLDKTYYRADHLMKVNSESLDHLQKLQISIFFFFCKLNSNTKRFNASRLSVCVCCWLMIRSNYERSEGDHSQSSTRENVATLSYEQSL
ncbi:hypothetical protein ElyMa_002045700 [Elysia marginata]|uniref:Uncharacterized protein n=1 Tax=Elysia marginata TaxID=1093978 RepID=A0AAV4F8I9_9GAST|nr:hypothetical protein ElyMa_002045700 [Elysia marginata]